MLIRIICYINYDILILYDIFHRANESLYLCKNSRTSYLIIEEIRSQTR